MFTNLKRIHEFYVFTNLKYIHEFYVFTNLKCIQEFYVFTNLKCIQEFYVFTNLKCIQEFYVFTNLKCIQEFYVFTNLKCIQEFYVFTNLCALVLRIEFKFKMANGGNGQRAEYENWERYFLEVVDLLDECERVWTMHNASSSAKEYLEIQLELLILSLQHLLPLLGRDNRNVFREVLRNVCFFHDTWKRTKPHSPTDVAIYTLEGLPVFQCGAVGRPRLHISEDVLLNLRSFGFTWEKISEMLLVSRWTLRRRVVEFGLDHTTGFSEISNEQLDTIVTQFLTNMVT